LDIYDGNWSLCGLTTDYTDMVYIDHMVAENEDFRLFQGDTTRASASNGHRIKTTTPRTSAPRTRREERVFETGEVSRGALGGAVVGVEVRRDAENTWVNLRMVR